MSWTKLGDEFLPAAESLSDHAFRLHVEALIWSSWRLLDLRIPKSDVRRFAGTANDDAAVKELLATGWWENGGDHWYVGVRWPDWQETRGQVEKRRAKWSQDKMRRRAHETGDHDLCTAKSCEYVSTVDSTKEVEVDSNRESDVESTSGHADSSTATRPMSTGGPGVGVGSGEGLGEREVARVRENGEWHESVAAWGWADPDPWTGETP